MIKKIILITLFVLFSGVLIAGAINRTTAKSANELRLESEGSDQIAQSGKGQGSQDHDQGEDAAGHEESGQEQGERQGQGQGNGGAPRGQNQKTEDSNSQGSGTQGQGQGQRQNSEGEQTGGQNNGGQGKGQGGQGQNGEAEQGSGQGSNQGSGRAAQPVEEHDTITIEGVIIQAPLAGVDMIIEANGNENLVGTGPGYLQEQGFELAVGDEVRVSGFWEADEFKAETITRLSDGAAIALRDEYGRPMWSGAGRNAQGGGGRGQGQGQGQSQGQQTQADV